MGEIFARGWGVYVCPFDETVSEKSGTIGRKRIVPKIKEEHSAKKKIIIMVLFTVLFVLVLLGINWLGQKEFIKNIKLYENSWLFVAIILCIATIHASDKKTDKKS